MLVRVRALPEVSFILVSLHSLAKPKYESCPRHITMFCQQHRCYAINVGRRDAYEQETPVAY